MNDMNTNDTTPLEIERRFLVRMPDLEALIRNHDATVTSILQTYLKSDTDGEVKRVRQRGRSGDYVFYVTTKRVLSSLVRTEEEAQLSAAEYLELLMTADTTLHQIRKDRYCFDSNDLLFELDVYPFWHDKAILEVELDNETQEISLPAFITVIKEVSDDASYSNHNMAKTIPV